MKKVTENEIPKMIEYLEKDASANLFLLGDLEQFGLDPSIQDFYINESDDNIDGVLFRYLNDSLHIYADKETKTLIKQCEKLLIQQKYNAIMMAEKTQNLLEDRLYPYFKDTKEMSLSTYTPNDIVVDTSKVERLSAEDAKAMLVITNEAFDRNEGKDILEKNMRNLENGTSVSYGVRVDDALVAVATYVAESKTSAMIVGVATLVDARGHGFATAIVKKMSDDLWLRGKQAVLFYDNPQAASIYEKIGFAPEQKYYMNNLEY